MQSSILFLGTGTGPGVVGKGVRSSGGIILKFGNNQFHIDPGVGAITKASDFGVSLRENTAVLVSHSHVHHANDVNAVIEAMTYGGLDKQGVLIANKTAINGTEDYPPIITKHHRNMLERFIAVDRNQRIGINEIEIQTLTARHSEPNTIGFKIFAPDVTITYTSDTVYSVDIVEQYMGSNILILNVPYLKKKDSSLSKEDAIKIIEKVQPRLAILTHFDSEMANADPIYEIREIQRLTKVQCLAAKDGMIINPSSYAAGQGQKTLQGFKKEAQSQSQQDSQES